MDATFKKKSCPKYSLVKRRRRNSRPINQVYYNKNIFIYNYTTFKKNIRDNEINNKSIKWCNIAKQLQLKSGKTIFRIGKQCRERWNNHLDPTINRYIYKIKTYIYINFLFI